MIVTAVGLVAGAAAAVSGLWLIGRPGWPAWVGPVAGPAVGLILAGLAFWRSGVRARPTENRADPMIDPDLEEPRRSLLGLGQAKPTTVSVDWAGFEHLSSPPPMINRASPGYERWLIQGSRMFGRGLSDMAQKKFKPAARKFREAAAQSKATAAWVVFYQGTAVCRTGDYETGAQLYAQAISLNPRFFEAYNALGAALLMLDRPGRAVRYFKAALSLKKTVAEVYVNLGLALARLGKLVDAVRLFIQAAKLKPNLAKIYLGWGVGLLEETLKTLLHYHLPQGKELGDQLIEAYWVLGRSLIKDGEYRQAALYMLRSEQLHRAFAARDRKLKGNAAG